MVSQILNKDYGYSNWKVNWNIWWAFTLLEKEKQVFDVLSFNGQDKQAGINIGIKYWSSVDGVKGRMLSNLMLWKTN